MSWETFAPQEAETNPRSRGDVFRPCLVVWQQYEGRRRKQTEGISSPNWRFVYCDE
jgi:hypothetical protein